ncbi:MAG: hypothetical protein CMJ89_01650, partial [Planctomycetes bacterium]|nr:hypothetical protein [Planctomycetota bacterium]
MDAFVTGAGRVRDFPCDMSVFTRLLALFLSFITVGNLRPLQNSLDEIRPEGWFGRGELHRVYFDAEDAAELRWLRAR